MDLKLTRTQRLHIALFGRVYLEDRTKEGWKGTLPFYAFKCRKHSIVVNYPEGYYSAEQVGITVKHKGEIQILSCPICAEELLRYLKRSRKRVPKKTERGS